MPLVETLPVDARTAQWSLWSTTARVVVTDPARLADAEALVRQVCEDVERACSRFRPDAEIAALAHAGGRPVAVTSTLFALLAAAVDAARRTDGDVDPTVARAIADLGYDRDLAELARPVARGHSAPSERVRIVVRRPRPGRPTVRPRSSPASSTASASWSVWAGTSRPGDRRPPGGRSSCRTVPTSPPTP